MVDNETLNWASGAFDLEAEAIHHSEDRDDRIGILCIIGWQKEVVGARDSGLVEDGKLKIVTQSEGKIVGRCVGALRFPVPDVTRLVITMARGSASGSLGGLS